MTWLTPADETRCRRGRRGALDVGATFLDPRPPLDDRFLDLTDVVRDRALHHLARVRDGPFGRVAEIRDVVAPRRDRLVDGAGVLSGGLAQTRDRVVDLGTACRGRQLDLPDVPGDGALHPLEHLDHCLLRLAAQRCDLVSTRGDRLLDRAAVLGRSMRQSPERLLDADVELLHARVDRLLHVREPGLELREAHPGGLLRLVEALEQLADCAAPVGDDLVDPAGEPGVECSGTLLERSCRRRRVLVERGDRDVRCFLQLLTLATAAGVELVACSVARWSRFLT